MTGSSSLTVPVLCLENDLIITRDFYPWKHYENFHEEMFHDKTSDLPQRPVKLWKVPAIFPCFHHAHLLIAADSSAIPCSTFHDKLSKGKVPLICCPESDFDIATKLEKIFSHNEIASVTVIKMDKPCCRLSVP